MGSNQAPLLKKRFYQVKIKSLEVASLKELGQLMDQLQRQAFRKTYGKIWDLAMIEVSMEAMHPSLSIMISP